jgi:hypothetical protein
MLGNTDPIGGTQGSSPAVEAVTPGSFATADCEANDPQDEQDSCEDPKHVCSEAQAGDDKDHEQRDK